MPRKVEKLKKLAHALHAVWDRDAFTDGNRCGNDPNVLRPFTPPKDHRPRPPIIRNFIQRIEDFYANPNVFETLAFRPGFLRQMNSCRREACIKVLGVLAHYFDLATMKVGIPQQDGGFVGIDMVMIALRAEINLRRAERAMHDLVKAGLVKVHKICESLGKGEFRSRAAIRTLSRSVFKTVGLGKALIREHKKALERKRKREVTPPKDSRAEGRIDLYRKRLRDAVGLCHQETPPTDKPPTDKPPPHEAFA
ncbi:MAG: replication protein RepA [Gammaproteobacteria bacterium]|nr:replication protein RepA [Gammaproteobacteria bacterium]